MLVGPVPGVFEELLTRQIGFVDTLLFEALDDLGLCSNRGVVGAGHPAGVLALEASATNEDILYRLVQHVPHMQHTRHIGRRDHDRKGFTAIRLRMKKTFVQPVLVPAGFNVCRIVL